MVMEKMVELLAEHLGQSSESITADTTFEALGVDSLDTVELLMELEEHLGIEIELDEKVTTVGELVAFIEKKME